uniref:Uncharacterized protein n=1 Tax=Glossina austeni TaxID=7395 RepID=A0A1A9UZL3_GLOAU
MVTYWSHTSASGQTGGDLVSDQPREISSFKILTPPSRFDCLLKLFSCPEGALVKEFLPRKTKTPSIRLKSSDLEDVRSDGVYKNGGGVLIAVKRMLPAVLVTFAEPVTVQFVGVMLKPNNISLLVTVSYTPSLADIYLFTTDVILILASSPSSQRKPTSAACYPNAVVILYSQLSQARCEETSNDANYLRANLHDLHPERVSLFSGVMQKTEASSESASFCQQLNSAKYLPGYRKSLQPETLRGRPFSSRISPGLYPVL